MDRSEGSRARARGSDGSARDDGVRRAQPPHTFKIERLSLDLPIVVEIVDTREKLGAFLDLIDDDITEGLVTIEKAEVRLYRSRKAE